MTKFMMQSFKIKNKFVLIITAINVRKSKKKKKNIKKMNVNCAH